MERFRELVAAKLGRCSRCMRWSGRGTIASWTALGALAIVWPEPILLATGGIVAAGFTLLLLAHAIRFGARYARAEDGEHERTDPGGVGLERRRFLGLAAKAGVAGLALSLFGKVPPALAVACDGRHAELVSTTVATNRQECRKFMRGLLAQNFCVAVCSPLDCVDFCVNVHGRGHIADLTFDEITNECTAAIVCDCACGTGP